jgi:serine protease Do
MRKYILTSIVMLPLLLSYSHAAQYGSAPVDPPGKTWFFSSEDNETGSYLGVDIADVTSERLSALKLKEEKGVEVTMVDQDAPAGKAGIKEHDVILSMNGASVESAAQLRRMIHEMPAGRVVTFGLSRDGQPVSVKVQLADRRKDFSFVGPDMKNFHVNIPDVQVMPDIDMPGMLVMNVVSARSGLTVENITTQLGEFFGVKGGSGVLVRSVEKGSRAEKAGFRAGDVIVKINDQAVHDTSDFTHAVRSRNGNSINVAVVREKKEQNLNLTMPERKDSSGLFDEESFEGEPLFQADSALELSKLQDGIAKLQPQIELAKEQALENSRKAMDAVRKSMCDAQKEFRQQSEKQREQIRKQEQDAQQQLRKEQEELRKNMERLRQSMRNWAEI